MIFGISIDIISLVVDILGFIATILIFAITTISARKATEDQTRRECVRATLTEFAGIRRTHQGFTGKLDSDNRTDILKGYLSDLERFAVGCNHKAYTVDIVNSMSGGMLVNQYNKYFKEFITERRRLTSLEANVKPWNMYNEYEKMMKQVFELRGLEWESQFCERKKW